MLDMWDFAYMVYRAVRDNYTRGFADMLELTGNQVVWSQDDIEAKESLMWWLNSDELKERLDGTYIYDDEYEQEDKTEKEYLRGMNDAIKTVKLYVIERLRL